MGGPRPSLCCATATVSTPTGGGDSPVPPSGEAGEGEEQRPSGPRSSHEGNPQGMTRESALRGSTTPVPLDEAHEGRTPERRTTAGSDQQMEETVADQPVRVPTAAKLTALMQQPSMLAVLQSLISQATAKAQEGQAHVASERIAQAEREAEEAKRELRQQELELEKIRGHQTILVAERAAQ